MKSFNTFCALHYWKSIFETKIGLKITSMYRYYTWAESKLPCTHLSWDIIIKPGGCNIEANWKWSVVLLISSPLIFHRGLIPSNTDRENRSRDTAEVLSLLKNSNIIYKIRWPCRHRLQMGSVRKDMLMRWWIHLFVAQLDQKILIKTDQWSYLAINSLCEANWK